MGVKSIQITLGAATATPLVTPDNFTNIVGANSDELPVLVSNLDAAIVVWVGGPGVTAATGTPIAAGQSLSFRFMGTDASALFAIGASGTPKVAVLVGRTN